MKNDNLLWKTLSKLNFGSTTKCISEVRFQHLLQKYIKRSINESILIFKPQQKDITALSVYKDKIIISSDDASVNIFNIQGKLLQKFKGHRGGVWTFAQNDKYLVTGSTDRCAIIWDINEGMFNHILKGHSSTVRVIKIMGDFICTGGRDGVIRVWNFFGECLYILNGHTKSVRCLDMDTEFLISGSYDGTVIMWNYKTGQKICNLEPHKHRVYTVLLGKKFIASSGVDSFINVSNTKGKFLYSYKHNLDLVMSLSFTDNERFLVSLDVTEIFCKWDLKKQDVVYCIKAADPTSFSIHNDLLFLSTLTELKVYDYATGLFIRRIMDAEKIIKVEAVDNLIVVGYSNCKVYYISIYRYDI